MPMKRLAVQGYRGCFHEEAGRLFYEAAGEEVSIVECPTFAGMFTAMAEGRADAAVMAIENTISGGLIPNFELLRDNAIKIKGEIYIPIHQNLMALPGQRIEDIREVRTHYMAINQTRRFFQKECAWITMVESEDTAKSATDIARGGIMGVGAVASELAARQNGLWHPASRLTSRISRDSSYWTIPWTSPGKTSTRPASASPSPTSPDPSPRCSPYCLSTT